LQIRVPICNNALPSLFMTGLLHYVLPKLVLLLITRVYKGLVDVANIRPCALLFGLIVASEEKK